jgi:DNA topoisomerase IA
VLRAGQELQRVTFSEVTQKAVKEALQHPRQVGRRAPSSVVASLAVDCLPPGKGPLVPVVSAVAERTG